MKHITISFIFFSLTATGLAQQKNATLKITAPMYQQIKTEVEKDAAVFKKKLLSDTTEYADISKDNIEFTVDTFKIFETLRKGIEIDNTTYGMADLSFLATAEVDKLMNKYNNRLLKSLNKEHRQTLINTQKAWINYRDLEKKLIGVLNHLPYSSGGSLDLLDETAQYSNLVLSRLIEIYNYYKNNSRNENTN
jgi:hypothetical protein